MSTAVATQQLSQSLGSPRHQDRKALVSSDGKNGNVLFQFSSGAYMDLYGASQICNFNDIDEDACIFM